MPQPQNDRLKIAPELREGRKKMEDLNAAAMSQHSGILFFFEKISRKEPNVRKAAKLDIFQTIKVNFQDMCIHFTS